MDDLFKDEADSLALDFTGDDALSGFRLRKLQVFNWGTFSDRVWTLQPSGENCLLTGDIGSGKSTLVDAVTTLLVPANKIDYNKAAGAEKKERHLRSYVLGYYKSERNNTGGQSRPVALRDQNSYSVVLGEFHNEGYDQTVTLAQVFWMKETRGQPERFYVCAEKSLTIETDFSQFGSEINALRKRLRGDRCQLFDHFPQYGAWFRRRFGIDNEQALDLFHQTVSMKSVGNLTDFVRQHMLEPFDVAERIKSLIEHFDDLSRAHQAVQTARLQIEELTPLVDFCDTHKELQDAVQQWRAGREALECFFSSLKAELLELRLERLHDELQTRQKKIEQLNEQARQLQQRQNELKQQIADNGGDRIESLKAQIQQQEEERRRRSDKAERYRQLLAPLEMQAAETTEAFLHQQAQLDERRNSLNDRIATLQNQLTEKAVDLHSGKKQHSELQQTIDDLASRQSNIEQIQINIRRTLCEDLSLDEEELPFAGELLQVRGEDKPWQGAIERLMRNFGLSMLVPDEHYKRVAQWVDKTHLRGRLVYYRTGTNRHRSLPSLHPDSLVHKLAIKPDSAFYPWLEQEIAHRFDLACCDSQKQFRREKRAITLNGQIKSIGGRHEKDDRFALNDYSRFVLGWSNRDKIQALENRKRKLETQLADLGDAISTLQQEKSTADESHNAITRLEEYRDFRELDWQPLARLIAELHDELAALGKASDLLLSLTATLKSLEQEAAGVTEKLEKSKNKAARTEQKIEDNNTLLDVAKTILNSEEAEQHKPLFPRLEELRPQALGEHMLSVESCDSRQSEMRKWLQDKIDAEDRRLDRLLQKIVNAMSEYNGRYPLETSEVDVSIESAAEYRQMLDALQADDLPRFEARFKELLNENTIREVANFQSQLHRERETIRERIEQINESLTQIDYNPGRYIRLEAQATQDVDIRDFQGELRTCTEGALTGSEEEQYSEQKFLQVKHIIERFRGREGLSDQDRRWTAKVTDVRNWFSFAASERWREDHQEHEHYADSGGKSGGQKEKLAYTILAASLAYQFGLEWGTVRSRTFRFVVIDEAFGRGSDESAQYGLRLFSQLNLQLLIVTPLQKIHIIEPFVSAVGFVHNDGGETSRLRNLTIEAYREEKATSASQANA